MTDRLKPYIKKKTRFTSLARIDPKTLLWIKANKDTKTVAGFLDKIINKYKQEVTQTTHLPSHTKEGYN